MEERIWQKNGQVNISIWFLPAETLINIDCIVYQTEGIVTHLTMCRDGKQRHKHNKIIFQT